MANLTFGITMADTTAGRFTTALCSLYCYQSQVLNAEGTLVDNPVTAQQFAFERMVQHIKDITIAYEIKDLSTADKITKTAEINALPITMGLL